MNHLPPALNEAINKLERTGFRIVLASRDDPAYADYLCVKTDI